MDLSVLKQHGFIDMMMSGHSRLTRAEARKFLNSLQYGAYTDTKLPSKNKDLYLVPPRPNPPYIIKNNGDNTFAVWI